MDRLVFDVCIIDEGGRSTVPELLIPLMRSRKAIIIGDHYQLPPSIAGRLREADAKESLPFLEETFLKTSFFEQLYENLPSQSCGRLLEQFRMVEPIGDLVADLFYNHKGERGLFNGRIHDRKQFLDPEHTLRWHNVESGRQEKENGVGPSLLNVDEANAVVNFLRVAARRLDECKRQQGDGYRKKTVAIITPYGAQKRLIRSLLESGAAKCDGLSEVMKIEVDTVDSFQGSEADIVLYSTVRTHGDVSFLLDRQRLNVACSRARENLVFFGSTLFLRERESRSKKLLFSTIMERSKYEHGVRQVRTQLHRAGLPRKPDKLVRRS
jgi:superfamily I DNA and/or RNA helicase